jgi:putative transposase
MGRDRAKKSHEDECGTSAQQLKCLIVTDEFTKEGLAIDVDGSIRSTRVIEVP